MNFRRKGEGVSIALFPGRGRDRDLSRKSRWRGTPRRKPRSRRTWRRRRRRSRRRLSRPRDRRPRRLRKQHTHFRSRLQPFQLPLSTRPPKVYKTPLDCGLGIVKKRLFRLGSTNTEASRFSKVWLCRFQACSEPLWGRFRFRSTLDVVIPAPFRGARLRGATRRAQAGGAGVGL